MGEESWKMNTGDEPEQPRVQEYLAKLAMPFLFVLFTGIVFWVLYSDHAKALQR